MKKFKMLRYEIIILLIAIILSIPLLNKNLNVYFGEGSDHLVRAFLTNKAIENGESKIVLSDLANGFGYSWSLFYGPFSTIAILMCNYLLSSIVNSYKLVLFLGIFLSGITMYYLVKKLTDNKNIGIISAVLYMTMPYHLNDMYIRNALGEFLSFIFIPLIFLGLYNLFNKEEKYWLFAIGSIGLILTHNVMTIITLILILTYFCINLPKLKDKKIREKVGICIVFTLCISAFYWFPLFQTSISTKYTVYQNEISLESQTISESALKFKDFLVTSNGNIYVREIGIHVLINLY